MVRMRYRTIPIVEARFFVPAPPLVEPRLSGSPERLDALVERLEAMARSDFGVQVPRGAWLHELRLEEGEALLRVAPIPGVCTPDFAQAAFDLLRTLLHDTDIYVQTARH